MTKARAKSSGSPICVVHKLRVAVLGMPLLRLLSCVPCLSPVLVVADSGSSLRFMALDDEGVNGSECLYLDV